MELHVLSSLSLGSVTLSQKKWPEPGGQAVSQGSPPIAERPSLLWNNVLGSGRPCDGVVRHVPR